MSLSKAKDVANPKAKVKPRPKQLLPTPRPKSHKEEKIKLKAKATIGKPEAKTEEIHLRLKDYLMLKNYYQLLPKNLMMTDHVNGH